MKTIWDYNFRGKKAMIRVDFNVPLDAKMKVKDETRINATIPTLKKILDDKGSCILISHLGRPKEKPEDRFSLRHIIPNLGDKLDVQIKFADDCIGPSAIEGAKNLKKGEVLLLENVRFYKEETAGDKEFAQKLANLGNIYVNDAFGTAHRAHASTTVMARFFSDKCCGHVMQQELENAQKVLEHSEKPFTAIIGGAKISDKISSIGQLLNKVDHLIIGGGMSYTFFKAMGGQIGNSLIEDDKLDLAKELIQQAKQKKVELQLPKDSIIANDFTNDADTKIADNYCIPNGWMGLDIGPESQKIFSNIIQQSQTILWNGPMGVFEMSNFSNGTNTIAKAVVKATENGSFSLIGGGDSVAAINNLGYQEKVSYVSTGGGALLEYMEGKVLPGVAALNE